MNPNHFISTDALPCDARLFFGPLDQNDQVQEFDKAVFGMAEMAVAAGFFASKTQARKNGWDGPVPLGYGTRRCGKRDVWWFNSMDGEV